MDTGVASGGVDLARDTFDADAWFVAAPAEPWLEGLPAEAGLQDADALFGRAALCASFRTTVTSTKPCSQRSSLKNPSSAHIQSHNTFARSFVCALLTDARSMPAG
jgi:hypothetical protein